MTTEITIIELGGEEWKIDIPDALLEDSQGLQAAIAGELANTHPTTYVPDWTAGDPLPTLAGAIVWADDEQIATLTDAVPVGVGAGDQRLPEDAAGYLIHATNEHGAEPLVSAWYDSEPDSTIVAQHTGSYGGAIERLADGWWNYGAGWHPTLAEAVEAS